MIHVSPMNCKQFSSLTLSQKNHVVQLYKKYNPVHIVQDSFIKLGKMKNRECGG
jgi:hypothetical protein